MKLLFYLLALLIYNSQIMQVHSRIAIQNLQNKSGLHIGKKVPHPSFHKTGKYLRILQAYGNDHFPGNYNTQRDGAVPVLVITFLNDRNIYKYQGVIIFHFDTRTLFFIKRCPKIIHFNSKSLGYLKYLSCSRIGHRNPAILLWLLDFMNCPFYCLENPYHNLHSFHHKNTVSIIICTRNFVNSNRFGLQIFSISL